MSVFFLLKINFQKEDEQKYHTQGEYSNSRPQGECETCGAKNVRKVLTITSVTRQGGSRWLYTKFTQYQYISITEKKWSCILYKLYNSRPDLLGVWTNLDLVNIRWTYLSPISDFVFNTTPSSVHFSKLISTQKEKCGCLFQF